MTEEYQQYPAFVRSVTMNFYEDGSVMATLNDQEGWVEDMPLVTLGRFDTPAEAIAAVMKAIEEGR